MLIAVQDFTVRKSIHLYQFSQTKDELFLETIMIVVFLLHLTHLRKIDVDWTTQQGFVLERKKIVSRRLQAALSYGFWSKLHLNA